MKFHNGHWLYREGTACFSPRQVTEVLEEKDRVTLYAPCRKVEGKAETIDGAMLTVELTSPMEGTLRVRAFHHKGRRPRLPEFDLLKKERLPLDISRQGDTLTVRSGPAEVRVDLKSWGMSFYREGRFLTRSGPGDLAYLRTAWTGPAYDDTLPTDNYMREQLSLSVDEHIYGLGERFSALVKNGQSVDIYNQDGGTSSEQSYKNIPFYLSDRAYGVFVNSPQLVGVECGTEQVSKVGFSLRGEELDYFLFAGEDMMDVLRLYTDLTGKSGEVPQWSLGLWLSTSFTTDYDEKTVLSMIDGMEERGIPLSVFHFDCCWMKPFHWTDFIWDPDVFPDPAGLIAKIHQRGLKVCVWVNPYIAQASALFDEGMEKGYLLRRRNGDVWQWDMWQSGMAIVDFTNPEAKAWYQRGIASLMDMGVDAIKTDFGERIPLDVEWHDGSDPERMHNFYPFLYNQAVYETIMEKKGEACLFARSACPGGQRFPVHWGGDCFSDYPSMEQSLRGGLSLTSSGFGFWSHDIGGFEAKSTPDVYKRWAAFGLLSTHSRLHGSTSYRVPWNYDEEAVEVVRFFTRLKHELTPYLYSQAMHTSRTGEPMLRMMALAFPEDENCRYLDKQYMLGDSLLVAPVFNDEGMAHYYLPAGRWTSYLTGEVAEGPVWRREKCSYLQIPLWVKEGSVLPVAPGLGRAGDDFSSLLTFKTFFAPEGKRVQVWQKGEVLGTAEVTKEGVKLLPRG